jgi:hypothetical protein
MSEEMPIVEWLRLHDCWGGGRVDEAADRIEELEARYHREQDRIERLIEENERLRGALRDIARLRTDLSGDFSLGSKQSDIARAALENDE